MMVDPMLLLNCLEANGVSFYTGVPDSLLMDFCACIADHHSRHVVAANEGGAVALGAGYYLATGELALVYMQNSGFGNAINPLTSLTDPSVYGIPLLLLIGWRGEPGKKDEPQHIKQGAKTVELLETLCIPYAHLDATTIDPREVTQLAAAAARERSCPYALVVREKTFNEYKPRPEPEASYPLTREQALRVVLDAIGHEAAVVCTTGMTSREVFEYRARMGQPENHDFLMVGSMGHASQIALGIALGKPGRPVCCIDGDAAAIMHLGSIAIIGSVAPRNLRHILINNGAHDSVGGQPSAGFKIDFPAIASACGYTACLVVSSAGEISNALQELAAVAGPTLLEIRVRKGNRRNLGRPAASPWESKSRFMDFLRQ